MSLLTSKAFVTRLQPQLLRSIKSCRYFTFGTPMYAEQAHRGYKEAVIALNSLQSNANVLAAIQAAGPQLPAQVFAHTTYYLHRLGYKPENLNALNVVHISGTKGKGSTAAFCSSLLTTINPKAKVGLYTSPHLVAVRERIRINGKPISQESFATYFWEVWDRFEDGHDEPWQPEISIRPAYFRYLTFMAYHVFLSENVDATILEVGVGGLLDPTNLIPSPMVTGVTSLGLDHVHILGHTILEIAGHKGGIFKPGVPALSVQQQSHDALDVLRARAIELKASSFSVVPHHHGLEEADLGLAGHHQKTNAALAIALINTFMASPRLPSCFQPQSSFRDQTASTEAYSSLPPLPTRPSPNVPDTQSLPQIPTLSPELITPQPLSSLQQQALRSTKWPGRCQVVQDPQKTNVVWSLDGAHTTESVACCGTWWRDSIISKPAPHRILVFNCTSGRSGKALLQTLVDSLSPTMEKQILFTNVIISTNVTFSSGVSKGDLTCVATQPSIDTDLSVQNEIAAAWRSISDTPNTVIVARSIEDAVANIHQMDSGPINVLVTGSLHLVGGVLEVAKLLGETSS